MAVSLQVRHSLARAGVLAVAGACVYLTQGASTHDPMLVTVAMALLGVFLATLILPTRVLSAPVQLGFLAVDLIALAVLGCALVHGSIPGADARIPFLCAYLVATLVAVVGHRFTAAVLGALGGAMILAVGTALLLHETAIVNLPLLGVQLALIVVNTMLTDWIAGGLMRETRRHELMVTVDREIKAREAAAAELVSFTQTLADSNTLAEIAGGVLRHLRHHTDLAVRAVVLESEGEEVALWEEAGSTDPQEVERRRLRLQESLAHVGSHHLLQRLQCHSTGIESVAKSTPQYRTAVDLPIQVGGRTAGVLFLGDTRAGALPPDRIGVLVDVARRTSDAVRRLERNRGHENRRTSVLLRQMREGVLLLGSEGQVLLANPAARRAVEVCSEPDSEVEVVKQIGGLTLADLAHTPPGISRKFRATIQVEGHDQPTQLACTAIGVLDHGRRIGTLVTLADVTEEEATRGRIIQAEKMTLVGQTLAGVAHELNNPLAALIGYADLLRMQELPEEISRPVNQMREQALRATRIVRNLLNFARRRNPERVSTDVADLVRGTVELFAYEARMADVDVALEIADDLPPVLADKHALQQVLVNLFQNALHALEKHDGERSLTIRATPDPEGLLVSVSDSGPGVPAELRARVFDSFFTTKGQNKGTGLGLALSRTIAQEHGGDLLLAAGSGTGACFTLRLPRHTASRAVAGMPAEPGEGDEHMLPSNVLVVDDEASVRETLVAQLGNLGATVDSAGNAVEAERMMGEKRYDAMVVDIRMPGRSGLDLHDALMDRDPFLADRIVFMTGDFVNGELIQKARHTGRILLEKPFTMPELATALSRTAAGFGHHTPDETPDLGGAFGRRSA